MRRFGDPFRADRTYVRRPGAYAILPHKGDLLLTLQDADAVELQLPGGGIDPGETPVRALHREVFEETGYHIANPKRMGVYQRYTFMPEYNLWAHKICHIYLCQPTLCLSDPPEPDHTAVWMDMTSAISLLSNDGDRFFLLRWLQNR